MGAVPAQAAIVSRAHASVLPSFPKRGPLTALVMAATVLIALASVIARALISGQAPAQPMSVHRRRRERPEPASVPPAYVQPRTRPKPSPAATTPPPAAKTAAPASSIPSARRLPVVIPPQAAESIPPHAETKAEAADAKIEDLAEDTPSTPPAWQAKEPPKRPSWLHVSKPRRPRATPETEPEAVVPTSSDETEMPATPAPEPAASPKPAATGLLDRLRQEFSERTGKTKKKEGAQSADQVQGGAFLDRFRRSAGKTSAAPADSSKPAAKGVDMAALSPNDLRHYLTQRIASTGVEDTIAVPPSPKVGNGKVGPVVKSLDAVLNHIVASASGGLPRAILVAGVSPDADAPHAAIGLARALVDRDEQVVLVDLAKGASAVSGPLGMPRVPGFTDLAVGRASFGDVIRIDGDTPLQVITAGNPTVRSEGHEPDQFMRVFEALTAAYDCVVLHADLSAIDTLMPALKFELPMMVAVLPKRASVESADDALSTFQALGCPIVVYETNGRLRRARLFSRTAAV